MSDDGSPRKRPRHSFPPPLSEVGRPELVSRTRPGGRSGLYDAICGMPEPARKRSWAILFGPAAAKCRSTPDERGWVRGLLMHGFRETSHQVGTAMAVLLQDEDVAVALRPRWNPNSDRDALGNTLLSLACTGVSALTIFDDFDDDADRDGDFGEPSADWLTIIRKLIEFGADPLVDAGRPLLTQRLHPAVFDLVLGAARTSSRPNPLNRRHCVTGQTPLTAQIEYGNAWAVLKLLGAGADPNFHAVWTTGEDWRETAGSAALWTAPIVAVARAVPFDYAGPDYRKAVKVAQALIDHGAAPDGIREIILGSNTYGFKLGGLLRLLVGVGAPLSSARHRPLVEVAATYAEWECVEILLEGMAGPGVPPEATAILETACATGTFPGMAEMVQNGKHSLVALALRAAHQHDPRRTKGIVRGLGGSIAGAMRTGHDWLAANMFRVLWPHDGYRGPGELSAHDMRVARVHELFSLLRERMGRTFACAAAVIKMPSPDEARSADVHKLVEGTASAALVELVRVVDRYPLPGTAWRPIVAAGKAIRWILEHRVFEPADDGVHLGIEDAWTQMFHTPVKLGLGPPLSFLRKAAGASWAPVREALRVVGVNRLMALDHAAAKRRPPQLPRLPYDLWDYVARIAYVLELCGHENDAGPSL